MIISPLSGTPNGKPQKRFAKEKPLYEQFEQSHHYDDLSFPAKQFYRLGKTYNRRPFCATLMLGTAGACLGQSPTAVAVGGLAGATLGALGDYQMSNSLESAGSNAAAATQVVTLALATATLSALGASPPSAFLASAATLLMTKVVLDDLGFQPGQRADEAVRKFQEELD